MLVNFVWLFLYILGNAFEEYKGVCMLALTDARIINFNFLGGICIGLG